MYTGYLINDTSRELSVVCPSYHRVLNDKTRLQKEVDVMLFVHATTHTLALCLPNDSWWAKTTNKQAATATTTTTATTAAAAAAAAAPPPPPPPPPTTTTTTTTTI